MQKKREEATEDTRVWMVDKRVGGVVAHVHSSHTF